MRDVVATTAPGRTVNMRPRASVPPTGHARIRG